MKERKISQYDDGDGRVICSMDVEDVSRHTKGFPGRNHESESLQSNVDITNAEARSLTASALLAALVIGSVFSLTWVLFTLFLTQVVFR